MNSQTRQYLFGVIFIGVAMYHAYIGDVLEVALYGSAGLAFIVNAMTFEPRFQAYKKTLAILTWILMAAAALLLLYLLQFKF